MRSLVAVVLRNKRRTAVWAVVVLTLLVGAFAAAARATDQSSFCASCHEMAPYYDAWSEGPHAEVACIECHVDPDMVTRMTHKVTALGEVYGHFFGELRFPSGTTDVPDERCLRCHSGTIDPGLPGFVHAEHAEGKRCMTCHATAGHDVSATALAKAGVLDPEAQAKKEARDVATVGGGKANLPGHVSVPCSNCHDLAATGCVSCHEPGHEPRDASTTCTDCHAPGIEWAFTHPARTDCATCHTAPAEHFTPECATCHTTGTFTFTHPDATAECTTCHERPAGHRDGACTSCHATGTTWAFTHPAAGANCVQCHAKPAKHYAGTCSACHTPSTPFAATKFRHPDASATCTTCHRAPAGHRSGACTTCHRPATSWAFTHPSSTNCAACHSAPAGHYSGSCTSCHTPGTPFRNATFRHPDASATCTTCHGAPAGHRSGTCTTCHRPATSWAFYHPSSTSCASCHSAPANHYGTTCASCHSPGVAWRSATFTHARIPGGEHTYRSFSCTTCHPGGYSSYSCLQCHSSNNPD
jgi:nitrate/TMAO reductase-like tetraheme cytochrome c subunit